MTFTRHALFLDSNPLYMVLLGTIAVCALLLLLAWPHGESLQDDRMAVLGAPVAPRASSALASDRFSVLQGRSAEPGTAREADFLSAFRFAGTFFLYGPEGGEAEVRRGVLSYLPANRQEIVSEGDVLEGVRISRIQEDCMVLEKDGVEGTLYLRGMAGTPGTASSVDRPSDSEAGSAGAGLRLGEQTGDGVWMMDKEALMRYYEDVRGDPERLLQVFDSMRPLYTTEGSAIEGYTLQAVGEQAFFDAVGFREGDVVRRVNSLPMTNRGRAEFFIRQVVQGRLSAVVIDIERGGRPKRMVYQLR